MHKTSATEVNSEFPAVELIEIGLVNSILGQQKTQTYDDEARGLLTPRVKNGRSTRWPRHEIQAIAAARLVGLSEEDQKNLVQDLVSMRAKIFAKLKPTVLAAAA